MLIDRKPRDFNYIQCKDKYLLEIKGTMKRRSRSHSSNNTTTSNTEIQSMIDKKNRAELRAKILENYQDLKSCVPIDLSNNKRRESIKTYDKQNYSNVSGAALLMSKATRQNPYPEKKHLTERNLVSNRVQEVFRKQKRHFEHINSQNFEKFPQKTKVVNSATTKKLQNDIYSRIQLKQNIINPTVKMSKKSMFIEGINLGYEQEKQSKISWAKQQQVMGEFSTQQCMNKKTMRCDRNKSSFVLD